MSTKGREAAKIAAIIGGGAVVGAALGLLLAPKAGRKPGAMSPGMPSGHNSKPPVSADR